jgi:hypothetical protein
MKKEKEIKINWLVCFSPFVGDSDPHRRWGKEEEKKPISIALFPGSRRGEWIHAPPVAMSRGEDAPPLFLEFYKAFPAIPGVLGFIL